MDSTKFFHFFYGSVYGILGFICFCLLLVTPGDTIVQVHNNDNIINQVRYYIVIGGCYVGTAFIAFCIYVMRRIGHRQALKDIPKTFIPIEKGEVSKEVRKMIEASLRRNAAIAWDSRPHITSRPSNLFKEPEAAHIVSQSANIVDEPETRYTASQISNPEPKPSKKGKKKEHSFLHRHRAATEKDEYVIAIPTYQSEWEEISHNGWSSPTSPDLPNLQYITVILELPHLIEARAVSMAPADPESMTNPPMPDLRAVDLLQRPASMGLRNYIGHLASIRVIISPTTEFLAVYEQARFGPQPLSEPEFRNLMALFADLLRDVQPLDPDILESLHMEESLDMDPQESDTADDVSTTSTPRSRSPAPAQTPSPRSVSEATAHTAPSRCVEDGSPTKGPILSTAPAMLQKHPTKSRSITANSFAQSKRPYNGSSGSSSASLRSSSSESVIRLSRTNEGGLLPYTLTIPGAR